MTAAREPGETQATAVVRRCVGCGSTDVNLWASWNLVGEWICNDCAPSVASDDYGPGGDW